MKSVLSLEILGSPIWGWLVLAIILFGVFAMSTDARGCVGSSSREACAEEYYDQTHSER